MLDLPKNIAMPEPEVEDLDMRKSGLHGKLLSDAALCKTPMTPKSLLNSCLALSVFGDSCYQDKPTDQTHSHIHDASSQNLIKRRKVSSFSLFRTSFEDDKKERVRGHSPTVRRISYGEKSLCFIYWENGPEHFIYNEVIKVFFNNRARSSVNLRRILLGTFHTHVERTDYSLARTLKDNGVVDRRSCSNLKLIAMVDLLRLIASFKLAPRMKTGHKEQGRILLHIAQVNSIVREVSEQSLGPLEKLCVMTETGSQNED